MNSEAHRSNCHLLPALGTNRLFVEHSPFTIARTRVLIIEDNPVDRKVLKHRLSCIPEAIFTNYAESLTDARRFLRESWDLILLDLHLPGSRGLETLKEAQEIFPEVPIIVLTGISHDGLGSNAVKHGAQDYLVKSDYDSAVLQRTIRYSRERFKLIADLRAQRARLDHILAHTTEGIVAVRADSSVQFANRAALDILGQTFEQLRKERWKHPLDPDSTGRIEVAHPERGLVIAELRLTSTEDASGSLFLCTLRDVTEEQRLQKSLVERQTMAAVGELSAGVAHEFNNMLAAVQANIELIMMREPANELAKNAMTALDRGKTLVQDLMTFNPHKASREGRTSLARYFTANEEVINKLLGPRVEVMIDPPPPRWTIPMGSGMLNQIIINLAVNARDAMPEGGRFRIRFSAEPPPPPVHGEGGNPVDRGWACISFSDTGCGMPKDACKKVFDAFYTTKGSEGNGLGLTAVKNLVCDSGGEIVVESTVGTGTSFKVWFPRYDSSMVEPPDPQEAESLSAQDDPIRVLFVEDEELLRMAMSSYLDIRGYDVTSVADGQAALDAIELTQKPFDAVVSDQIMPRLSGTGFLEQAIPLLPHAVFILTSAHDMRTIGRDWTHFDQVRFLGKPYHGQELHDTISELLRAGHSVNP